MVSAVLAGKCTKPFWKTIEGDLVVEAVNDLMPVETNAHMLRYDSTYGRFPGTVEVQDGDIVVNGQRLKSYAERDPSKLPWGDLGIDIVLECTGIFRDRDSAGKHLDAGAKR
jgi:glyceraldehyde 3-phosphate dehydrogenase